jgi:hypothetical protein
LLFECNKSISVAVLAMLSVGIVRFPKNVIESLDKDQEIKAGPERGNV